MDLFSEARDENKPFDLQTKSLDFFFNSIRFNSKIYVKLALTAFSYSLSFPEFIQIEKLPDHNWICCKLK